MGDEDTWKRVIDIIKQYDQCFVIVSATARTTRHLVAAAEKARTNNVDEALEIADEIESRHRRLVSNFADSLSGEHTSLSGNCDTWISEIIENLKAALQSIPHSEDRIKAREDAIASTGEQLSSYLFAQCCKMAGVDARWIDATDIIRTDSDFGQANPDSTYINENLQRLETSLAKSDVPVMGGYYGEDSNGNITTLGFEGSDYTASLVGAALDAEAIEIWTDVSGIYTCDPRYVADAKPIKQLSFQEATELAYFGAKVLHPSTTKPAAAKNIPLLVKNIFEPEAPGTIISGSSVSGNDAKAITFKENGIILTVTSAQTVMGYEFLAGVFDTLRYFHMPVDAVTTTEASVSISIEDRNEITDIAQQLKSFGSVDIKKDRGIISLVGCRKEETSDLIKKVISPLEGKTIDLLSYSRKKGNLNLVVDRQDTIPVVQQIHRLLFE